MKHFLLIGIVLICAQCFFAQSNCSGTTLFTETKCTGDEITATERELFRVVNEYRTQNNLPPVALSESLSFLANRHILDLSINVKYITHGWSDCPYDIKKKESWNCLFGAPQRLKSNYAGRGFENLYHNLNGSATPADALAAWKKSPLHNNLILNLEVWKKINFDAFGVAVSGNYAAIWFGSTGGQKVKPKKEAKGLGISFAKLVNGLTTVLTIEKESSQANSEKWVGKSGDNSIKLEIYGQEKNITETAMSFSVKLDQKSELTPQGKEVLSQFMKNIAPEWAQRQKWIDETLLKISQTPTAVQSIDAGKKTILCKIDADNYLTFHVKPKLKPQAQEF